MCRKFKEYKTGCSSQRKVFSQFNQNLIFSFQKSSRQFAQPFYSWGKTSSASFFKKQKNYYNPMTAVVL